VLTASRAGFPSTIGLATLDDLVAHYRGLPEAGVSAARLQCENYFIAPERVVQFAQRYGAHAQAVAAD